MNVCFYSANRAFSKFRPHIKLATSNQYHCWGNAKTQFTGKESETITISGRLIPEITGGRFSIKALELMADSGGAFPLIDGATFEIIGFFVIESVQETRTEFFGDGAPRAIDFSMSLKRTDDPMLIAIAESLMSSL